MLTCKGCGAELGDTLTGGAICSRTGFSPSYCEEQKKLEDAVFSDLPDLEVLLWKVVHQTLIGYEISYDDNEMEMIHQVAKAVCPICTGTGQISMSRDGQPIECRTCKGRGR